MKRRNFIKTLGTVAAGLPLQLNGMAINVLPFSKQLQSLNVDNDKILVLINMAGGNDSLNTVIPLDQYSNLSLHRPDILIPETATLSLTTETALHPAMTGLKGLYDNGELAVIQSVGYPNPNRSHFRSTDIMETSSDSDVVLNSGFLGRYFDTEIERINGGVLNYPDDYPNTNYPDPFALSIGSSVSLTCQGLTGNYSLAMEDPFNLNPLASGINGTVPTGYYGDRLSYLRTTLEQTNEYGSVIQSAANAGNNLGTYPANNKLAEQLRIVANLISGGIKTKVFVLRQGGYDTHDSQVDTSNSQIGEHAELLTELSDAIAAFQADIKLLGIQDKIVGMTYSEFGRRIKANGGYGTDHGDAGAMFVFGSKVNGGIVGNNPIIPSTVTNSQALPMQYDYREVFQDVIQSWFCAEDSVIQGDILLSSFSSTGTIIGNCPTLPIELLDFTAEAMKKDIALIWETGLADNFKEFQVERSADGLEFRKIKTIGYDADISDYNMNDSDVRVNRKYYYRLKMVDLDNSFEYSAIRSAMIKSEETLSISIYPNPVRNHLNIESSFEFDQAHLFILDKNGRPVYDNENWDGSPIRYNTSRLPNGIYVVQSIVGTQVTTKKFLKVK